jgi:dihydrofolate reductase
MSRPRIALVVAVAENRVIGKGGKLPWRIPEDMRWFKEKTMGKPCIVARKTYESFPKRPLPGRTNIVLTHDRAYRAEGAVVVHALDEALAAAARESPEEIAVLGGTELYAQILPKADRIYLTSVHGAFEGDAMFPYIDPGAWRETIVGVYPSSPERPIGYSFIILDRK